MTTDPDADTLIIVIALTTLLVAVIAGFLAVRKWQREEALYIARHRLNDGRVTPFIPRDFKVRK